MTPLYTVVATPDTQGWAPAARPSPTTPRLPGNNNNHNSTDTLESVSIPLNSPGVSRRVVSPLSRTPVHQVLRRHSCASKGSPASPFSSDESLTIEDVESWIAQPYQKSSYRRSSCGHYHFQYTTTGLPSSPSSSPRNNDDDDDDDDDDTHDTHHRRRRRQSCSSSSHLLSETPARIRRQPRGCPLTDRTNHHLSTSPSDGARVLQVGKEEVGPTTRRRSLSHVPRSPLSMTPPLVTTPPSSARTSKTSGLSKYSRRRKESVETQTVDFTAWEKKLGGRSPPDEEDQHTSMESPCSSPFVLVSKQVSHAECVRVDDDLSPAVVESLVGNETNQDKDNDEGGGVVRLPRLLSIPCPPPDAMRSVQAKHRLDEERTGFKADLADLREQLKKLVELRRSLPLTRSRRALSSSSPLSVSVERYGTMESWSRPIKRGDNHNNNNNNNKEEEEEEEGSPLSCQKVAKLQRLKNMMMVRRSRSSPTACPVEIEH